MYDFSSFIISSLIKFSIFPKELERSQLGEMDGVEGRRQLWKNLKQRLRFKRMGCCGSSWGLRVSDMTIGEEQESDQEQPMMGGGVGQMNLATALAAERNMGPTTALKSLMRLFEETDGQDLKKGTAANEVRNDSDCCVCMERNKGAALIPCGHTYCRVCSRELWLNRGFCPLCNRTIMDVLDIF